MLPPNLTSMERLAVRSWDGLLTFVAFVELLGKPERDWLRSQIIREASRRSADELYPLFTAARQVLDTLDQEE